jgi:hypothetical protein
MGPFNAQEFQVAQGVEDSGSRFLICLFHLGVTALQSPGNPSMILQNNFLVLHQGMYGLPDVDQGRFSPQVR